MRMNEGAGRKLMLPTTALLLAVAALAAATPAGAATVGTAPLLTAVVGVNGWSGEFDMSAMGSQEDLGEGTHRMTGESSQAAWDFGWDLEANADPFITGNLTFTNTTSSAQTFNVVLSLPISPSIGTTVDEYGELGIRLSDANADGGATLDQNQWHGLINPGLGTTVLDMPLLIGSSFSCGGAGCSYT